MGTDIIAILLSSLALIGTCCSYLIHDIKIKKQQNKINEYEIKKINHEKENIKKAYIVADVIDNGGGKKIILISNKGMSYAKNVIVKIPRIDKIVTDNNPSPFNLSVGSNVEINLILSQGKTEIFDIEFEWQDDLKKENRASRTIQI